MTQFAFRAADFANVHDLAQRAEAVALSEPRRACFNAPLPLETTQKWLVRAEPSLTASEKWSL